MQIPKDDIRENILSAAEKKFQEKGFLKTSMRDIAEEAQVGL
ncbi:helix-turn-helix domain-containing protein, partial [Bacteroides heparinolyticus]